MHRVLQKVTDQIIARSSVLRAEYLRRIEEAGRNGPHRGVLSCGNLAHGFAACSAQEKQDLAEDVKANIAIVFVLQRYVVRAPTL